MRAAKVQASLRIRAISPEPSLLTHTSSESRGTFWQKARSLAPLNGWACAVKICHDGMLEDTNSLGGAHFITYGSNIINVALIPVWKTNLNTVSLQPAWTANIGKGHKWTVLCAADSAILINLMNSCSFRGVWCSFFHFYFTHIFNRNSWMQTVLTQTRRHILIMV